MSGISNYSLYRSCKNAGAEKVEEIPTYRITLKDGTVHLIDFIPADNVPGFTHRIAWNKRLTATYLGQEFRPGKAVAVELLVVLKEKAQNKAQELCSDCPKDQPGFRCGPCPHAPEKHTLPGVRYAD